MNHFKLTGKVTRIFNVHTTGGELVKAHLFVWWDNGKRERESSTLEILLWDTLATTFIDLVSVGDDVSLEGYLKMASYLNKQSQRISQLQLHANKLDILSKDLSF